MKIIWTLDALHICNIIRNRDNTKSDDTRDEDDSQEKQKCNEVLDVIAQFFLYMEDEEEKGEKKKEDRKDEKERRRSDNRNNSFEISWNITAAVYFILPILILRK